MKQLFQLLQAEEATSSVEYAVMLGLVIMAMFATLIIFGQAIGQSYADNGARIEDAMPASLGGGGS